MGQRRPSAGPVLPAMCPALRYRVLCQGPMGCLGPFVAVVFNCRNKNLGVFATFLRLGTPFRLCKAKTGCCEAAHLRFYAVDPHLGVLRQSLIAKKLQSRSIFCFWILARAQSDTGSLGGPPTFSPFCPQSERMGLFLPKIDGSMVRFMAKM